MNEFVKLVTRALGVALVVLAAACASRTVPPPALPAVLAHPEFAYPVVPQSLLAGAAAVDRGWRFLQSGDLRNADREFTAALKTTPGLYPAQTGSAYVALARNDPRQALTGFEQALRGSPSYAPALVGRGQALLGLSRSSEALEAFEAALTADPTLVDLRGRIDVLRFRNLEEVIQNARRAASNNRLDEARTSYQRALEASPDSAFLHRELGVVEQRRGQMQAALDQFRRAVDLDASDAMSLTSIGDILEQQQDFTGAEAAYRRAAALEPSPSLTSRIAGVTERARDARLPAEFRAIAAADQITRGDLAALIAVRLDDVLRAVPPREVVATDTAGHWAALWITQVARAGVMEPFENHTFQPRSRLRRADLAAAASRVVMLIAAARPDLRARLAERPAIADMATTHLDYPAASVVVAAGVMPLLADNRFQVGRAVSGAEALDVVSRLRALANR